MTPNGGARVTLKDIAAQSGYTVNTVSHALRGKRDIAPATRQKIAEIAREMGYVGNTLASSLRSGRSGMVAVIVEGVVNPHFSAVVHNVEGCLRSAGYSMIVLCTGDAPVQEQDAVRTALKHLADGVLICPTQLSEAPIDMLRQSGIPYVVMGRDLKGNRDDQVLWDDEGGAYLLTESLIARGHRRILYVGGEAQLSSERERLGGYRRALADAGMEGAALVCPFGEYAALEAAGALKELLARYRPSAVFAFRDAMAWTIINALRASGVRVPEDVSVAGFDYTAEHLHFLPALTTVAARADSYATVAARRLVELMEKGGQPPRTTRLAMRLVEPNATVQSVNSTGQWSDP